MPVKKSKPAPRAGTPAVRPGEKNLSLESLRGILALMVVIGHIPLLRFYLARSTEYFLNPARYQMGRVAVTGFFVLSGYLITLGILRRIAANEWSMKRFYTARIFRIWPLYYFVVLLAIFVLPEIYPLRYTVPGYQADVRTHTDTYWYFFLLLPQVPLINNYSLPFAEPTWSIGVEEIFYLVIPFVIALSKENLSKVLFWFIVSFVLAKYAMIYTYNLPFTDPLPKMVAYYRYDCVALGCLLGSMHFRGSRIFTAIRGIHALGSIIVIGFLFKIAKVTDYDYFPFALCFAVLIAYFVNKEGKIPNPKWLVYIGTISYSLYLTHEVPIVFFLNLDLDKKSMLLMHIVSVFSAVALASVTYYAIERPFMRYFKTRLDKNPAMDTVILGDRVAAKKTV